MAIRGPEFYREFADKHQITQKDAKKYVEGMFELLTDYLASGETVDFRGFARFEVKDRPAKVGRNPHTGESIRIPECRVLKVTAKKALKDQL